MRTLKRYIHSFISLVIILLFIIACTAQSKYNILSVFFDGVPDPDKENIVVVDTSLSQKEESPDQSSLRRTKEPMYFHSPYQKKRCGDCHNTRKSYVLLKELPNLCYNCHKDYNVNYKFLHGPVAMGACKTCHHPHVAKQTKLLVREGNMICLYCHNPANIFKISGHSSKEEKTCAECHNPHGGNDKYFLN